MGLDSSVVFERVIRYIGIVSQPFDSVNMQLLSLSTLNVLPPPVGSLQYASSGYVLDLIIGTGVASRERVGPLGRGE
jgi:hypothetical protein